MVRRLESLRFGVVLHKSECTSYGKSSEEPVGEVKLVRNTEIPGVVCVGDVEESQGIVDVGPCNCRILKKQRD